jgi:hypothetical protein
MIMAIVRLYWSDDGHQGGYRQEYVDRHDLGMTAEEWLECEV